MKRLLSPYLGYKGTCATDYCGPILGMFCKRCRRYVETCAGRCGGRIERVE